MHTPQDTWLVSEGNRLRLIPDSSEIWAAGHDSAVFRFGGLEYRQPQYASEWLALTSHIDRDTPVGIYFDMVMFPELIRWLNRGFENVERVRDSAFRIFLTESRDFVEQKWPFLPCEAFRSDTDDYVIWIPCFHKYERPNTALEPTPTAP
jgi:hypothetical protein